MASYLGFIIAAIVLGMIAYPVLQLVPSSHQKHQIALRQAAIQEGLNVQIRHPQLPSALANQYEDVERSIAYSLHSENKCIANTYIAIRSNNDDDWHWLNDSYPKAALLTEMIALYKTLPDYILAIEQSPYGSTVFWREDQDLESLKTIKQHLQSLNQLLLNN